MEIVFSKSTIIRKKTSLTSLIVELISKSLLGRTTNKIQNIIQKIKFCPWSNWAYSCCVLLNSIFTL